MTNQGLTIRKQLHGAVSLQSEQACINQHTRNIHTLYAMPDGRIYWAIEASKDSWDVLAGTVDPVAVIYQTGTGSCDCNCDACMAGDDPAEWAGDDAYELRGELIAKVDAIEVGYFDDEQGAMTPAGTQIVNYWDQYTGTPKNRVVEIFNENNNGKWRANSPALSLRDAEAEAEQQRKGRPDCPGYVRLRQL